MENEFAELKTGENVAIILDGGNVLMKIKNMLVFKESLEAVGRNDLATRLDEFLYPGESLWFLSNRFNQKNKSNEENES